MIRLIFTSLLCYLSPHNLSTLVLQCLAWTANLLTLCSLYGQNPPFDALLILPPIVSRCPFCVGILCYREFIQNCLLFMIDLFHLIGIRMVFWVSSFIHVQPYKFPFRLGNMSQSARIVISWPKSLFWSEGRPHTLLHVTHPF